MNITELKKLLKKPAVIIPLAILLLIIVSVSGWKLFGKNNGDVSGAEETIKRQVVTATVDLFTDESSFIDTVGTVKPKRQVDIVATTRGMVRAIFFEVGDSVLINTPLVVLFDDTSSTNLNNARTNLLNTQNTLIVTQRLTDETVRQVEIGVETARESVTGAEISLQTARDNLANAGALRNKGNLDTLNNAIISFSGFMNTIFTALDETEAILGIESEDESAATNFTNPNLAAKNPQTLTGARASYILANRSYQELRTRTPDTDSVTDDINLIVTALTQVERMVNDLVIVLDNTVSGTNYPQTTLDLQKANFIALRSSMVGSLTTAKTTLQSLENLDLIENQEITALKNAVKAAESQLTIALSGLANAEISLNNARQAKAQQILVTQSAVDNARGQLNLSQVQVGDLSIRAPISGVMTQKLIEIGSEVSIGQKIAELSQNEQMIIEVNLPSEQVYRIKKGWAVALGDNLTGTVDLIAPAADPITRKVRVEILFDNKGQELIQGTFIDVSLSLTELSKTHAESVFVPLRAVSITQNEQFVFTIVEGRAKKTNIVIGKTEGALVEVLDGLTGGDILVVEGAKSLEDGDEVELKTN